MLTGRGCPAQATDTEDRDVPAVDGSWHDAEVHTCDRPEHADSEHHCPTCLAWWETPR